MSFRSNPRPAPTEQRTFRIHGRVQGVSFRAATKIVARRLSLTGFARNQPDGSVLIVAEGPVPALRELERWCQHGPSGARVDRIEVSSGPATGYTAFTIE